jgi:hypothetical protein
MSGVWHDPIKRHSAYAVRSDERGFPIIFFEHHRLTLPVMWLAVRCGVISAPFSLVYFDHHPDLLVSDDLAVHVSFFKQATSFDAVVAYTLEQMSVCNDDWVQTAIACGFVSAYTHVSDRACILPLYKNAWWCDVDLDYFTDELARKQIVPWMQDIIAADMEARCEFWAHTLKNTVCLTVARESEFCGGVDAMKDIRKGFLHGLYCGEKSL